MMTDQDLETLYKQNINESHAAGLRGIFDAGYQLGLGVQPTAATPDESTVVAEAVAQADEPVNITTP